MQIDKDSAQVKVPPPLLLLVFVLIGVGLNKIYPLPLFSKEVQGSMVRVLGAVFFINLGLGVIFYCAWLFKKAQTDIKPWKTTTRIITSGIYGISRNPIYLSFVLLAAGISLIENNLWILLLQIPFVYFLTKLVIVKEEKYLEQKFGDEYRDYLKKTRRWL